MLFAGYVALRQWAFVRSLGTLSPSQSVLRTARADGCPALLGLFRPRIILPADFRSRYTRRERLLIFSHERTHLRRGDPLCNGFVALLRCLFWFNPLAHLASSCFRLDQELACDAAVLQEYPQSRRIYAGAMLKTQLADLALPIGCHWHSAQGLKERLRMVKRRLPSRARRLSGAALTALLAALVGCTTWTARPARSLPSESSAQIPPASLTARSVRVLKSPSGSVIEDIQEGRLTVGKSAGLMSLIRADSMFESHPFNYIVLEGHVHVIFTSGAAPPAHTQTIILDTDAAVIARQSDGSSVIQFDHGRMEVSSDPSVHAQVDLINAKPITPEAFYQEFLAIVHAHGFLAQQDGGVLKILPGPSSAK